MSFNINLSSLSDLTILSNYNTDYTKYILQLLKLAIFNEDKSIRYYHDLSSLTKCDYNKSKLREISLDKYKHKNMLIKLYEVLADKKIVLEEEVREYRTIDNADNSFYFIEEIDIAFNKELENANFYRIIYSMFSEIEIKDLVLECIVDNQKHAQILNWLYTKNLLD